MTRDTTVIITCMLVIVLMCGRDEMARFAAGVTLVCMAFGVLAFHVIGMMLGVVS